MCARSLSGIAARVLAALTEKRSRYKDLYFRFWKTLLRKLLTSVLPSTFLQPYRVAEVLEDAVPVAARLHQRHQAHHGGRGALRRVRRQAPLGRGGVAAPRWLHPLRGGLEPHPPPPPLGSDDPSESPLRLRVTRAANEALAGDPGASGAGWGTVPVSVPSIPKVHCWPVCCVSFQTVGLNVLVLHHRSDVLGEDRELFPSTAWRKFPWGEHLVLLWLDPGSGQFLLRDKPGSSALSWPGTALFYTVASLLLPTSLMPALCRCALLCAAGGLSLGQHSALWCRQFIQRGLR